MTETETLPQSNGKSQASGGRIRGRTLLLRALRRRCPKCGGRGIFRHWLAIRDSCPHCGYSFLRESGYFLGAQHISLAAAELVPMGLLAALLVWTNVSWVVLEIVLVPMAALLPLALYPFSCTLWMAMDLFHTPDRPR